MHAYYMIVHVYVQCTYTSHVHCTCRCFALPCLVLICITLSRPSSSVGRARVQRGCHGFESDKRSTLAFPSNAPHSLRTTAMRTNTCYYTSSALLCTFTNMLQLLTVPSAPPSPRDAPTPSASTLGGRRDTNGAKVPRPSPMVAQKPHRDSFKRENSMSGGTPAPPPPPPSSEPPTNQGYFTFPSACIYTVHIHVYACTVHVICVLTCHY